MFVFVSIDFHAEDGKVAFFFMEIKCRKLNRSLESMKSGMLDYIVSSIHKHAFSPKHIIKPTSHIQRRLCCIRELPVNCIELLQ